MNDLLTADIASVDEFLAHALELETESAERYWQLADNMAVHNNPDVASLFRRLAAEAEAQEEWVKRRGADDELPQIAPWDYKWSCPEGPKSSSMDDTHYLMNKCQALELALQNTIRGQDFYQQVAERSSNTEVQRIAGEMVSEGHAHLVMLREWLAREAGQAQVPLGDLDPPNTPE